jgi:hypothetical protein
VTFKNGQGERPAIAEANPIVKIVGWNTEVQSLGLITSGYGTPNQTLDLSDCYFPKLQRLDVHATAFDTVKFSQLSNYSSLLWQWGCYGPGKYCNTQTPTQGQGIFSAYSTVWIHNFYIADIVDTPIFLSTRTTLWGNYGTNFINNINNEKNIYLPFGSKIKFYASNGLDDCTSLAQRPLDNVYWNNKFEYHYTYN